MGLPTSVGHLAALVLQLWPTDIARGKAIYRGAGSQGYLAELAGIHGSIAALDIVRSPEAGSRSPCRLASGDTETGLNLHHAGSGCGLPASWPRLLPPPAVQGQQLAVVY
ncbi:hypothetical protein QBC47DRAFT_50094 [Echria macrotheca]|uniref:Uncharacterized protein n=1 Tax=Echria macrotheca TaxID=438768 RepID=A0AAJ0B9K1_9PEZI|nr:hypothetical protein QBC47DRAFT_50094 [Echria macrotheca]